MRIVQLIAVVVPVTMIAAGAIGCQTLQITGERGPFAGEDVLVDGGNASRHRYSADRAAPPFSEEWRYNAAAGFGAGSALLYRNAVIVGNRNGELHAIGLEDGKRIGFRRIGESLEGPLLIEGSRIFVANAWGRYVLTSYDLLDGQRKWRNRGIPFETAPVLVDEVLVAVDVEGNVRAFNPESGEELWSTSLGSDIGEKVSGQTSPIALADNRIFVVLDNGSASVLAAGTGRVVWTRDLGTPVYASPSAIGDTLLVPTTRGRLLAVSARDGSLLWEFKASSDLVRFTPPATDGASIYVGSSDGSLYRLSAESGSLEWRFDAPDALVAPPLLTNTHVFVGTMGRMLYVFDRSTGTLDWEAELKGRIKSGMAVRNGYLVVLTEPRFVYGFKMESVNAATP